MEKYYHLTSSKFLKSIFRQGLKPARQTRNVGVMKHRPKSNPSYIYLWKDPQYALRLYPAIKMASLLDVSLQDNEGGIERDYDQITSILGFNDEKFRHLVDTHESITGQRITSKRHWIIDLVGVVGIHFEGDLTENNLIQHLDQISVEQWDKRVSTYKTRSTISPEHLTHLF